MISHELFNLKSLDSITLFPEHLSNRFFPVAFCFGKCVKFTKHHSL